MLVVVVAGGQKVSTKAGQGLLVSAVLGTRLGWVPIEAPCWAGLLASVGGRSVGTVDGFASDGAAVPIITRRMARSTALMVCSLAALRRAGDPSSLGPPRTSST